MKDRSAKYRRNRLFLFFAGILALSMLAPGKNLLPGREGDNIRLMFYNVENLFDTLDSDLDDDEFLPGGIRRWNEYRYRRKLDNLGKVIIAAGGWSPPSIIGLCEVENQNVLSDLLAKTILEPVNYKSIYSEGPDRRGIGVALLYGSGFSLLDSHSIYPAGPDGDTLFSRSVLFAKFAYREDTLGIVVTHWPSRRGGVSASDRYRLVLAELIREKVLADQKDLKIIIMGDFNCEPGSAAIRNMIEREDGEGKGRFFNPSLSDREKNIGGSYKYQGRWLHYDQMIFSKNLDRAARGLKYLDNSFSVVPKEFLLTGDKTYGGMKPFSTWAGPAYLGGYSDHLPVVAELEYLY